MVEVTIGAKSNPCNSCVHRDCCKYVDDIQKEVKENSKTIQLKFGQKVFELLTVVTFRCDMYKAEAPDGAFRI